MLKAQPVFWSRWIKVLGLFLIVYGMAMVIAPQTMNTTLVVPLLYDRDLFRSMPEPERTLFNMLNGLMGAITIGWSIQIAWIAHKPFRKGEQWAWNAIAASVITWALLEFYVKLTSDVTGIGLFAHFGLLILFVIPLLFTYQYCHPSTSMNTHQASPSA